MRKRVFKTYVSEKTKSVDLMDRFEGMDADGNRYDQMLIENGSWSQTEDGTPFRYQLVVERCKPGTDTEGDITFTEFKKGYTLELRKHVKSQISSDVINEYSGKKKVFYFDKPYHLRAQNSCNRSGYGWEWDWSDGIGSYTEGTYYGETSDYIFAGVIIA